MFAVGHLALGYISGKTASKFLNVSVNIPLLFAASVIPDIDLLIPGLEHRGPTHSLIIFCFLFLPAFTLHRKRAMPYFIALAQHSLIGDYLTGGGIQLLWPVASNWYDARVRIKSLAEVSLEWIFFFACLTVMLKTRDAWILFHHHPSNLLLSVPILTVLLPPFFSFPMPVPPSLILPHLTYLTLFTLPILIDLKFSLKTT